MTNAKTDVKIEQYHPDLVLGLDVLIGDPEILKPKKNAKKKADCIYIPEGYVYRAEDFRKEQSTRGEACKELLSMFKEITMVTRGKPDMTFRLDNGVLVKLVKEVPEYMPEKMNRDSSRAQAISIACDLKNKGKHVAIMTGNDLMSIVANNNDIDVAQVNPDVYTGRRKIVLPTEIAGMWFSQNVLAGELIEGLDNTTPLTDNEYIEFGVEEVYKKPHNNDYDENEGDEIEEAHGRDIHRWLSLIGRYDAKSGSVVPIDIERRLREIKAPFVPRSPGQAMALDALLAPPEEASIVILSGIYGSGKTFLTTSAGILQTEQGFYDQVFVCPRDGALGKDIGFLPGGLDEKVHPKMKPIFDNIKNFSKLRGDYLKSESGKKYNDNGENNAMNKRELLKKRVDEIYRKNFECEALVYMHGRNITDSFIVYDEFQDMERYQAKALLTRIGDRSKCIVAGDPEQRTNPYLNATSNGLSYSASHLKGEPHTRIITYAKDEIERSPIVRSIANYL